MAKVSLVGLSTVGLQKLHFHLQATVLPRLQVHPMGHQGSAELLTLIWMEIPTHLPSSPRV